MKPITACLTVLVLAGTGPAAYGAGDATITAFRAAPVCCDGALDAMAFSPLEPGSKPLSLDDKSPAFIFGSSGKSYFVAFALPAGNALQIRVRSGIFQDASQGPAIFFPHIMLLDRYKTILTTVTWADDRILHAGVAGGPDYIETLADLSAFPSARFMVVYTDGDRIGGMEHLQHVVTDSAVTAPVTGTTSHMFFVEVPDPHIDQGNTTPVIRSPAAPGTLTLELR